MSNFGTLSPSTDTYNTDKILVSQGVSEGVMEKTSVLFDSLYPIGTILVHTTGLTPTERGLAGEWETLEAELALSPTADPVSIADISCSNTTSPPLRGHTHLATASEAPPHTHNYVEVSATGILQVGWINDAYIYTVRPWRTSTLTQTAPNHTHTGTIDSTGGLSTISIKGRHRKSVIWRRVR